MSTSAPTRSNSSSTHRSLVPARMDRLPWTGSTGWSIVGLGISWVLDGLEIQIVSNAGFARRVPHDVGSGRAGSGTDLPGRRGGRRAGLRPALRQARSTQAVHPDAASSTWSGSGIAGLSPAIWFLFVFRFVAGLGIGGEYAAINSAIDELIPSKYRGHVDIAINGTYWGGAALGAAANLYLPERQLRARTSAGGWPSSSGRCSASSSSSCAGTSRSPRGG